MRILVTRPKPEGEVLCELIRSQGNEAIYFPTIEIAPLNSTQPIEKYDFIIFVSPRAVFFALDKIAQPLPKIIAVGQGTAALLPGAICPKEWSSEGLLALPELQEVQDKKILIVKGEGGRELLADTLTKRGATVREWAVYKRVLPNLKGEGLLKEHKIDIIVCTSTDGIKNLIDLLGPKDKVDLLNVTLLVVSERLKNYAKDQGFKHVMMANNATHESILAALKGKYMTEEPKQQKEQKPTRTSYWHAFGTFLSIVGLVTLIGIVYITTMQFNSRYGALTQRMAQVESDSKEMNDKVMQATKSLQPEQVQANVEETYTRLMALSDQLGQLPLATIATEQKPAVPEPPTKQVWWKKGLWESWLVLQKIVVVRHNENNTLPLMIPSEREFLYQNLQAQLDTAIWGLLHHKPVIYRTSLAQLNNWIKKYFDQEAPTTKAVLTSLTELQAINVG